MARVNPPHPKRGEILDRLAAGEDPKLLAGEFGVKDSAMRGYVMQAKRMHAPEPPIVDTTAGEKTRGGRKAKVTALTEETAQRLCAMGFSIFAAMTSEPIWQLNEAQVKMLGKPLADSVEQLVPEPVAIVINTYAAPIEFFGNLSGIIAAKNRVIDARKYGRLPVAPRSDGAGSASPSEQTPEERAAAYADTTVSTPAAVVSPKGSDELAEALAQAKGQLRDEDEPPTGETLFQ